MHGLDATFTSEFVDFLQRLGRIPRSFVKHCSNCESIVGLNALLVFIGGLSGLNFYTCVCDTPMEAGFIIFAKQTSD